MDSATAIAEPSSTLVFFMGISPDWIRPDRTGHRLDTGGRRDGSPARRCRSPISIRANRNGSGSCLIIGMASSPTLRFWNRLSFRLAGLFALVTVLAVVLVGIVVYGRQKREVEDAVGTQLLNIARIGSLLIDPRLHAEAEAKPGRSEAYARVQKTLGAIRTEAVLPTPIYTLTLEKGMARLSVTGDEGAVPGTV